MQEADLKTLFTKIRCGDKDAFADVYCFTKQPVYTIIYRIVQNKETAEDLTHDLFLKLYLSPPEDSVRNYRAWIFQTAHNLAIDALRKKQCTELQEDLADSRDELDRLVQILDIESAIAQLSCIEREIFSLHVNADLPFRQIAPIVGLSLPAVYRRYRKALHTLQKAYNGGIV